MEIAANCDVDESVLEQPLNDAEKLTNNWPVGLTDLRKLLEDNSIDAVLIATPNHNHPLQAIWGCLAGKDFYVEKPCAYNIFQARQLLAAAQKYGRMLQEGQRQDRPTCRALAVRSSYYDALQQLACRRSANQSRSCQR
jgi:predicted dehydrogenase